MPPIMLLPPVLDHELDVALLLHLGGDQAREHVDTAARRHRNDDADRAARKRLRTQDARRERRTRREGRDGGTAIDGPVHGIPRLRAAGCPTTQRRRRHATDGPRAALRAAAGAI
jgi:hypothetical protein